MYCTLLSDSVSNPGGKGPLGPGVSGWPRAASSGNCGTCCGRRNDEPGRFRMDLGVVTRLAERLGLALPACDVAREWRALLARDGLNDDACRLK